MSGSQYQISFCQILESERRLQLSSLLSLIHPLWIPVLTQAPSAPTAIKFELRSLQRSDNSLSTVEPR